MSTRESLQNQPEQETNPTRKMVSVSSLTSRVSRRGFLTILTVGATGLAAAAIGYRITYAASNPVKDGSILSDESAEPSQVKSVLLSSSEFSQSTESPPNPLKFVRFNGQQGEFFIDGATIGKFANGRTGIIATVELTLDGNLKAKSQAPYRLYPEDTYQIATAADQYHSPADLAFFVDSYRKTSAEDPLYAPLVIRVVPLDKISDPNAHSLLNITLPAGIITEDPVRYLQFAADFNYIDVATKGYVDKDLNRINRVYLNKDGTATGRVDVLQYPPVYKGFIPNILNQFRQGFLTGWWGRYLH